MTYLEKARELKIRTEDYAIIIHCPEEFNLEKRSKCPKRAGCINCWNREMPVEVEK